MTIIGAVFLPYADPGLLPRVARAADDANLAELWLWEDCFRPAAMATMGAALALTRDVKVGIGLLPVPLRNVALTAMEVSALEAVFPGRGVIGVGHGVLDWMGQVGARAASPLTLLREYTVALRALLAGERVSTDGRYVHLDGVALDCPPKSPVGVHVGAIGAKTLRLSGEVADGTVLTGETSPAQVRRAREAIEEGRAAAGRTDPHRITVYVSAATGPDAADLIEADRRFWKVTDDSVGVHGDAATVADRLGAWIGAGADAVILQPTVADPDPAGFVSWVGSEVAPLLAG